MSETRSHISQIRTVTPFQWEFLKKRIGHKVADEQAAFDTAVHFNPSQAAFLLGSETISFSRPAMPDRARRRGMAQEVLAQSQHVDSFDGIRGLAILLVLIGHAGWFANGWVGVDLFFVLSGFLITGILRRSRKDPFYWRRFYIKRATRIFPPLLLGIAVAALLWPHPSRLGIAAYLLSLGNIVDMTPAFVWPLDHLWSLSVEEHFYLLWPFAVLSFDRIRLRRLLIALVVAVPLMRLLFTYLLPRHAPNVIYYLTPFRIDGIALGSLLALLLEEGSWQQRLSRWAGAGATLGAATYMVLWTTLGHSHFFPFAYSATFNFIGYSLVAMIAFFVVAYARLRPESVLTRMLGNRLLRGLGVISYGVYVYSWILLQFGYLYLPRVPSWEMGVMHMILSVAIAAVLFRFYEQPVTVWGKLAAARLGT